jgi:four helix bundle protein
VGDYRSLKVWRTAHQVVLEVYRVTERFPPSERYLLTHQLRRAAGSIPANLAEGTGRNSRNELRRYCRNSLGSANELEYHVLLARDLGHLDGEVNTELAERVDHVKRMLTKLIASLGPKT